MLQESRSIDIILGQALILGLSLKDALEEAQGKLEQTRYQCPTCGLRKWEDWGKKHFSAQVGGTVTSLEKLINLIQVSDSYGENIMVAKSDSSEWR